MSRYTFADYSESWATSFVEESERVSTLLGATLVAVHHIGSTSVPGLPAKPIIDLLPVVNAIADVDTVSCDFEQAGYRAWREYGLAGRRLFTKDAADTRTHNVHIYEAGNPDIERHLAFCAYLREHPTARQAYAQLKREAYAKHPNDIEAYNDHKDAWIKRVERLAIAWRAETDE